MVDLDILENSNSPYWNPLVCVIKKDGSICLCLDARQAKKIIISDRESPENINDILKRFEAVNYISTIDLVLDKDSRKYVAFNFTV